MNSIPQQFRKVLCKVGIHRYKKTLSRKCLTKYVSRITGKRGEIPGEVHILECSCGKIKGVIEAVGISSSVPVEELIDRGFFKGEDGKDNGIPSDNYIIVKSRLRRGLA